MVRVPRGCEGRDGEGADAELLPVRDRIALVGDLLLGPHEVGRRVSAGQDEPAREVVVVQVGLGDVRDPHARGLRGLLDPVRVPLRVDDERDLAVVDQVAAVPELGCVDGHDLHATIVHPPGGPD